MFFASPWYLLGALAASIPILIHLFGRRRARKVLFPSLMLIKAARRERTSLVRLRQVWLMILRALAILLLSLGLARPTSNWVTSTADPETQIVLLLDDSLSMRCTAAGRSYFDLARAAAAELLRALPPRQIASVGVASAPGKAVGGKATTLLRSLSTFQPSYAAVDVAEALQDAPRHGRASTARRHLYLITDLQATAWGSNPALKQSDRVTVIDCAQTVTNRAVTSLQVSEPPALPEQPVALSAAASQYGPSDQPTMMKLRVGAGELPPQTVPMSHGIGTALSEWLPNKTGEVTVEALLPSDALREDDRRWLVVNVRDRLRVSLLGEADQTKWVRLALAPDAAARVTLSTKSPTADTDVAVSWQSSDALRQFVVGGGGILLFTRDLSQQAVDALLGAGVLSIGTTRALNSPTHLASFDAFHTCLRAFANPAAGDLREPAFTAYREMALPPPSPLQVLAAYEDGTPTLLSGHLGRGRLFIANFDPTQAGGDLIRQPVFVPLMHRLVRGLVQDRWPELEDVLAGEQIALLPPASATEVRCMGPTGAKEVRVTATHWLLRPDEPGVWRLEWKREGQSYRRHFAVNTDPRESDPTKLTRSAVIAGLRPAQAEVLPAASAPASIRRSPLSLSTPLIALALLLLIIEFGLTRAGRAISREE